ncbi:RNA-binding protein 33 isoform X1 [Corythoichthys intestinalis]|uniref:RNA-binding protein 33 isoform X1 n=1 Tax=Corythoichthys intestinalis TaxID=161448 RepID=UPI0025A50B52|nr:RNA-binding protein 33 isoform X1 [Corythoichthys intestinalis]
MTANDEDYAFEYDKPGTERSRRRRGEDDDFESDLEEDLLEEFSPLGKKNLSEDEDEEELNDALLQSDEDEQMSGQEVSLNATDSLYKQENTQHYADDAVILGTDDYEDVAVEAGYTLDQGDEYTDDYIQDDGPEDQVDYTTDEVLDIQINEPIDGEFQDNEYQNYEDEGVQQDVTHEVESLGNEQQQGAQDSQVFETSEAENEAKPTEPKEDSDDDDDEDGDSGRIRFKSERKDGGIVRLADAGNKRRNIPETLELSDKAKKDLIQYEQQERQKRQNRYGGRGGGRGGGYTGYGMHNMRGGNRGRMNNHSFNQRGNMGMRSSRMPLLHLPHQQQHHHSLFRPRGPHPFQDHGRPHGQQPLQPLIPPHMTHRLPTLQPQIEPPPPRPLASPPPSFGHHHNQHQQHHHHQPPPPQQQQPHQPKNIHINPHFRGSAPSSVPVPLMPPAPSQPRPAVGPQRFPGPGDFHQHMPNNFGQPQRPPHHMEPFRNPPHQGPQDREQPLFMGGPEHTDPASFPGQLMFDHQGPNPHMNTNLQPQMPAQGHMGFGQPGPAFGQPGPQGPLGLFSREPPRPSLPHPQGHQGLVSLNQQVPPPNQARPFMNPRQSFNQQGSLFPPPQAQFGMQGLLHCPPQPPIQDPLPTHQPIHQQQHRQDLLHHQQPQQLNLNDPPHLLHHSQNLFQQQPSHSSPRHSSPRVQNLQQRNMGNRQRMNTPAPKQIHPQRNSNLRELPIAPGNANMSTSYPTGSLGANVRPVAKATQGVRPVQRAQAVPGGGRGRGQVAVNTTPQPLAAGRTVIRKEIASSTASQDPDEDEETREYRLKIEEQKRLREEILKRKELRRQMQAGVRKKELLDRINTQTPTQSNTASQQPTTPQNQPAPPAPQQLLVPAPQQQQQGQRQPPQQQRQGLLGNPNGAPQLQTPRLNVKTRLQMGKGNSQQLQTLRPGPDQQQSQPPQSPLQQQRRASGPLNANKPAAPNQIAQIPQQNIPVTPALGPGQPQAQGLKPGAKRTVMQRAKLADGEGQQVPQKVRVVKLSGGPGKGPQATGMPVQQQFHHRGSWPDNPVRQGVQRKVTMGGQQLHSAGGMQQAGRGGIANLQQNRVVVSGRGRGGTPVGRGGPMGPRQGQRVDESQRRTVTIEGLSSSTTEVQLQSLLRSIGPIEMFRMIPQQRKAVATFSSPQHAASFQISFHRHMIDLSHIDVKLIDG